MDYNKWDRIADELDDDDADDEYTKSCKQMKDEGKAQVLMAQHEAMFHVTGWLGEAAPSLPNEELVRLVRFIATTDKTVTPDIGARMKALVDFVRTECGARMPDLDALVALCHYAEKFTHETSDPQARTSGLRVLLVAMGALNTFGAIAARGGSLKGATALASKLGGVDVDSEDLRRFEEYEYAKEIIRESVKERDEREAKAAKLNERPKRHPVLTVLRHFFLHGGFVLTALLARKLANMYWPEYVSYVPIGSGGSYGETPPPNTQPSWFGDLD